MPEQKALEVLRIILLPLEVFAALFQVFELPENYDCAHLALTDVATKLVRLAHRQPEGR